MNREQQHLEATPGRKRQGFWWKIPAGVLLVLILILVVAWTQISAIALWAANRTLPGALGTGASVKFLEIKPRAGLAVARGVRIAQPKGFGDGILLELDDLILFLDIGTIAGGKRMVIRNIEMQGLRMHLVRNAHGAMNAMELGPPREARLPSSPAEERTDGAEDALDGMADGLLETAGSVLKGDLKKSTEHVHDTAKHTANQVSEAVRRTGRTTAHTATKAVGQMTGAGIDRAWTAAVGERHRDAVKKAQADLAGLPFPPSVLGLPDVTRERSRSSQ